MGIEGEENRESEETGRGEEGTEDFSPKHTLFGFSGRIKSPGASSAMAKRRWVTRATHLSLLCVAVGARDGDRSILRQLLLLFSARARVQQAAATAVTATLCILFARCTHQSTITFSRSKIRTRRFCFTRKI